MNRAESLAILQAKLEMQRQQAAIEAQKKAAIEESQARYSAEDKYKGSQQTREEMSRAKNENDLITERQLQLMTSGMSEGEALFQARRDIKAVPVETALLPATTARNQNEFNTGRLPLQRQLGGATAESDLTGQQFNRAQNNLGLATTAARMRTAPAAAAAQDLSSTNAAQLSGAQAGAQLPYVNKLADAQASTALSNLGQQEAGSRFQTAVTGMLDPANAAADQMAKEKAGIAAGTLVSSSGAALAPGFANTALANPMMTLGTADPLGIKGMVTPAVEAAKTAANGRQSTAIQRPKTPQSATVTNATSSPLDLTEALKQARAARVNPAVTPK